MAKPNSNKATSNKAASNKAANVAAPVPATSTAAVLQQAASTPAVTPKQTKASNALAVAMANNPGFTALLGNLNNLAPSFALAHARTAGKALPTTYTRNGVTYNCPNGFIVGPKQNPKNGSGDFQLVQAMLAIAQPGQPLTLEQAQSINLQPHNIRVWLMRGWLLAAK